MHIPFPRCFIKYYTVSVSSIRRSSHPRRARSGQLSGPARAVDLRAVQGRRYPGERKEWVGFGGLGFFFFSSFPVVREAVALLLCGGWEAQAVTPAARKARCTARGVGQFALAAQETWDSMLFAEASFGGASFSAFLLRIRRKPFFFFFIFILRVIHENLFFGHLLARDAPVLGCRRMEGAVPAGVQGSYPSFASFSPPCGHCEGSILLAEQFV